MVEIVGRKVESVPNKVFIKGTDGIYAFPRRISALETTVKIDSQDYALVQEGNQAVVAKSMEQQYNGHNHKDSIVYILKAGLTLPRASRFTKQLVNVNQALQGKGVLYDASGNLIEGDRLKAYAHTLNHDCWVWLPESFEKGRGYLDLDIITISGLDEKGNPVISREPLEKCLEENCWADLASVNSQGFPTQKVRSEKYEPGKTVYSWYPRKNSVAWFYAYSDKAIIDCYRDVGYSSAALGVFMCAEGAEKNSK